MDDCSETEAEDEDEEIELPGAPTYNNLARCRLGLGRPADVSFERAHGSGQWHHQDADS